MFMRKLLLVLFCLIVVNIFADIGGVGGVINESDQDLLGMPTIGRAVTATLFVSPNGDDTDFIFNAGTRISASAYGGTSGKTIKVWLQIQEY